MAESIPDVLEYKNIRYMVAVDEAFPYPCAAEDGDQDANDELQADHGASMYDYDLTNLCNKQIELKREVSAEHSGHA